jgi:hypothetical protein
MTGKPEPGSEDLEGGKQDGSFELAAHVIPALKTCSPLLEASVSNAVPIASVRFLTR